MRSKKLCLRFLKSYFKMEVLKFLSFVVYFLVDNILTKKYTTKDKAPFLTKKISVVKSETHVSREAIEN